MSLVPINKGEVKGLDVSITTDLTSEPVTLDEAKEHLKIDHEDEDDLITSLIKVARQQLEKWSGLAFGAKTIKLTLESHTTTIEFPIIPVNNVSSIKANAGQTNEVILATPDDYFLIGASNKRIKIYTFHSDIEVIYTTPALSDIPYAESIKRAVLCQVAFLWANRGDEKLTSTLNQSEKLDNVAKMILQNHRKVNVF